MPHDPGSNVCVCEVFEHLLFLDSASTSSYFNHMFFLSNVLLTQAAVRRLRQSHHAVIDVKVLKLCYQLLGKHEFANTLIYFSPRAPSLLFIIPNHSSHLLSANLSTNG